LSYRLFSAEASENQGVFRERRASKKRPEGFQVSTKGQIAPLGKAHGEEKTAEEVIFPTISVIFDRGTAFLWPNSMTQMI
jgi:hypothetical protein